MSEIAPDDKLQQLDSRHSQLLEELDALNVRLEETLSSFLKPAEPDSQTAS